MAAIRRMPENENCLKINKTYLLRLYVTGATPNSTRAISNLKEICEKYIEGNYELEIIDVYQQPGVAEAEQLIALPLLIKKSPSPQRRLIGDLSDIKKVLKGLSLADTYYGTR